MVLSRRRGPEPPQECPECGQAIKFKIDPGESLKVINLDGTPHICPGEDKPRKTAFSDALVGRVINGFTLRDRQLRLYLDGNEVFEVWGVGLPPLKLRLVTKGGILEE